MRNKILLRFFLVGSILVCVYGLAGAQQIPAQLCFQDKCFTIEIVDTPEARRQGLMGRAGLDQGKGMWFEFPASDFYSFWMKGVSFPIDMVWLDAARKVVHVEKSVPPCQEEPCPIYRPLQSAQYVLEIPSGSFEENNLKMGDQAELR